MSFSLGIVGLPNVGKSTLFNALTRSKQANVQNYPFCTIEPNVGVVEVPDERLGKLATVSKSKKVIPTVIQFVDIAGLVKGASEGAGLGNAFLSHIREVDAIVQVVRVFSDPNIIHVHDKVDPKNDVDVINLELILADLQTISKRLPSARSKAKGKASDGIMIEIALLEKLKKQLEAGQAARSLDFTEEEKPLLRQLSLLTTKPMMYAVNVDETIDYGLQTMDYGLGDGTAVYMSAKLEAELADLSADEAKEYMKELGMEQSGLDKIIVAGYKLLNFITYFTSGEPETRAWTVPVGTKAPQAAGVIHTDFVKGFIKADVCSWQDFATAGGWSRIKETGKCRLEGKEYVVKDGDVCYFHISA